MSPNPYSMIACHDNNPSESVQASASGNCQCGTVVTSDRTQAGESTSRSTSYRHWLSLHRLRRLLPNRNLSQSITVDIMPTPTLRLENENESDITSLDRNSRISSAHEESTSSSVAEETSESVSSGYKYLPQLRQLQIIADRTAEMSEHAMRSLLFDILPWALGCYVLFFTFRRGGLGVGFTAFLLLVSIHGVVKWWTARDPDAEEPTQEENNPATPDTSDNPHHHHHHQHDDEGESEDSYTSDELDDEEHRVIVYEPPPSYEYASNPTPQDLCLGLEVHLTPPGDPRTATESSVVGGVACINKNLLLSSITASSFEADENLPSYSEAVKKFKKKKRRSQRNGSVRSDTRHPSDSDELIPPPYSVSDSKNTDVCINIPSDAILTSTVTVLPFVTSRGSTSSQNETIINTSENLPSRNVRISTTDANSILSLDLNNRSPNTV